MLNGFMPKARANGPLKACMDVFYIRLILFYDGVGNYAFFLTFMFKASTPSEKAMAKYR